MAKLARVVFLVAAMVATVGAHNVLIGVYYGLHGDDLPPPWKVVTLCRKYNIRRVRLSVPNMEVLSAFRGAGIDLSFGIPNDLLTDMATNKSAVEEWFNTYVQAFINDFKINYIIVGDKAIPGLDDCILPVMITLQDLLNDHYLGQVKLTTFDRVSYQATLAVKDPPSRGIFYPSFIENMKAILNFLLEEGSPLMVSVLPYRKYNYEGGISLNYAIFNETEPVVRDGELNYYNLFDAMLDTFYTAIDNITSGDVDVVVGETGWPTCGNDNATTPEIAAEYNRKLVGHITSGKGTPKKPDIFLEAFIESLFNEDEKPQGDSQCYGMFNASMIPAYSLFNQKT